MTIYNLIIIDSKMIHDTVYLETECVLILSSIQIHIVLLLIH